MGIEKKILDSERNVPDWIFEEMTEAVKTDNPRGAMKEVLYKCRGQPYFNDAIGKARVMLLLNDHYVSRG